MYLDLAQLASSKVLYLTTTGRTSGQPRTLEIWFTVYQHNLYLNAEHGYQAHWVRNILHQPRVRLRLQEQVFDGQARVLQLPEDDALWRTVAALSRQKYGWGDGLPVEICPLLP